MSDDIMFCGLGTVPKGKVRAPPEYCLQKKQVRYYGKVAIDSELLEQYSKKETSLFKEQMKLKKIEDQAKKLIREVKRLKITLTDDEATNSQIKQAQKRMDAILKQRDKLIKRLKEQKDMVTNLEKEEKKKKKNKKNKNKKNKKKA